MGIFSLIILFLLIGYFIFWIEVFRDPRYLEVKRELIEEFLENGKSYKKYSVLYVVRSLNEIIKSFINNERNFYKLVSWMIIAVLFIMFIGIVTHFEVVSLKIDLDKFAKYFLRL